MAAEIGAADADPRARQDAPVARGRRTAIFVAIGAAAYLVALIFTLPARFAIDAGPRWATSGTIWNGEAIRDGAYRVEWHVAPLRSLAAFALANDVRLTGTGTDITGVAIGTPRHLLLQGLSGRADAALLNALAPGLPFICDAPMQVDLPRLRLDERQAEAVGEVRFDSGGCTAATGGASVPLPALLARAVRDGGGATRIEVAPIGRGRLHLLEGGIADGRLRVAPTPEGLRTLPFLRGFAIDETL